MRPRGRPRAPSSGPNGCERPPSTRRLRPRRRGRGRQAEAARKAVTLGAEQTAALAAVTVPRDLGELTTALTGLRTRQAELDTETDAAEEAYRAAQAALGPAPPEAAPAAGQRPAAVMHATWARALAAWNNREQAAQALARAPSAAAAA